MAYRLKRGKPVASELSRIVAKEFDAALEQLIGNARATSGENVHEARKSVKKIRAVLRLLRRDLGKDSRILNGRLGAVAHQLSPLRDVDATAEIVKSLRDHYRGLVTPSVFASVHREFLARKRGAAARLDPRRLLPRAARELRRLQKATAGQIRGAAGQASMSAGVRRGYRRARKAMARVRARPEDACFHRWRRRVKDHWYHVRLLEGLNAQAHPRARRLRQLETGSKISRDYARPLEGAGIGSMR